MDASMELERSLPQHPPTPCTFCATDATLPVWDDHAADEFVLRRCPRCHLVVTHPRPDDLAPYYAQEYYGKRNVRFVGGMEKMVRRFASGRARRITAIYHANQVSSSPPGRVLDVGCGRGVLLADLRSLGWECEGVEMSEHAVQYAREELGLNVDAGGFDPDRFAESSFDAVIFWHVLEHLVDVRSALQAALRILKPGGLLVVAVPNFASWQAAWTGYSWFHLDMPRHLSHFEPTWLRQQLEPMGGDVVRIDYGSLEQNPYGWIQSLLNRAGVRRNLLYDILKNRSARREASPFRRHPWGSLVSVGSLPLLLPFALLMNGAERLMATGATFDLYARKRS